MDNMTNAIESFRGRNRYISEGIPDYLPSQEEDVFSFGQLQLHQHEKKNSNTQKHQMTRRPSMYEKIVAELSQNSNSDHLQIVGSSQEDLDKNDETENLSLTSSSMSGNNGLRKRHLSTPSDRFSTYARIVHELSTDQKRSLDGSMSVIGGGNNVNRNTSDDSTGLTMDDYGQLLNEDFTDVSQESHVPPLNMLKEDRNPKNTVSSESSGMNFYSSKEIKNYVNNINKLQAEGTYDDHSLNQENGEFSQICDQNLLNQVSSLSIYPTAPSKDDSIVNNQLKGLSSYNLDSNVRAYESTNQHIDNGKQNDLNRYYLLSTDGQEPQSSNYISGPHTTFSSTELSNNQCYKHDTKERSSTSLLEYLSPSNKSSYTESTPSQYDCGHDGSQSIAESSRKDWGVSGAIKGLITGVFGETVTQTSPERAQQVKEISDLNIIFRY